MSNIKDSLDTRLAKGEISLEEYQKTLATLEKHNVVSEKQAVQQTTTAYNPADQLIPNSGLAIASLVLGISSMVASLLIPLSNLVLLGALLVGFINFIIYLSILLILAIPGVILGLWALKKIKNGECQGKKRASWGIRLNAISLVILFFGIVLLLIEF